MALLANFPGFFREIQSATKPTVQLVAPGYYVVAQFCGANFTDSEAVATLKAAILTAMDKKYRDNIKGLHWVATFLDPTLKFFAFVPDKTRADRVFKLTLQQDVVTWTEEYMRRLDDAQSDVMEPTPPNPKVARTSTSVFSVFRDQCPSTNSDEELEAYGSKSFRITSENPQDFWKLHASEFPKLARIAKELFAVQGSSAQSERDFSTAGLIRTAKRSQLSARQVSAIELISSACEAHLLKF